MLVEDNPFIFKFFNNLNCTSVRRVYLYYIYFFCCVGFGECCYMVLLPSLFPRGFSLCFSWYRFVRITSAIFKSVVVLSLCFGQGILWYAKLLLHVTVMMFIFLFVLRFLIGQINRRNNARRKEQQNVIRKEDRSQNQHRA